MNKQLKRVDGVQICLSVCLSVFSLPRNQLSPDYSPEYEATFSRRPEFGKWFKTMWEFLAMVSSAPRFTWNIIMQNDDFFFYIFYL